MTDSVLETKDGERYVGHLWKVRLAEDEPFVDMIVGDGKQRFQVDEIDNLYTPESETRPGQPADWLVRGGDVVPDEERLWQT